MATKESKDIKHFEIRVLLKKEMGKGRRQTEAGAVDGDQLSGGGFGTGSRSQQLFLYSHFCFVVLNSLPLLCVEALGF